MKKLYAFWKYNSWPYALPGIIGSEVKDICSGGKIKAEGYPGFLFTPIKILPLDDGIKIRSELDELTKYYKKDLEKLNKSYLNKVNRLLGMNGDGS